ncbi:MAG: type II toxin-antitoxin system VapC family toxin [Actinomycetota bacterium]
MKVLADSHTVLWATLDDDRLPPAVRDLIGDVRTRIVVSVATTWELMVKTMAGRLRLPEPPADYFRGLIEDFDYEILPIHQRHVDALPELPTIHGDPFDRMLVAQAIVEELDIVTGDEAIARYPVRTIW